MTGKRRMLRSTAMLIAGVALCASTRAQSMLTRTSRESAEAAVPAATREVPLRSMDGERIGAWTAIPEGVRLSPRGRREVLAPVLQTWIASQDGRTLVGAGDPVAFEHARELQIVVLRDGERMAVLDERLAPESEITVGDDGRVAIAGHPSGEPGRSFAVVLEPDGRLLHRHALPEGTLGRDPALFGARLLVRVHGIFEEGIGGSVMLVEEDGARTILDVPGALSLVGFPAAGKALVRSRDGLIWLDVETERIVWRRRFEERPAGPHAWELWRSDSRDALAVVTAGLRRRGAPAVAPALLLLDPADGSLLGRYTVDAAGPVCEVDVLARPDELVIDWRGAREVFRWER